MYRDGWRKLALRKNPARDRVVARAKELMDKELLAMADDVATHPEIGFEETRSVQKLTDDLKQHGFAAQMGVVGRKTAFVARYKQNNDAPTLGGYNIRAVLQVCLDLSIRANRFPPMISNSS